MTQEEVQCEEGCQKPQCQRKIPHARMKEIPGDDVDQDSDNQKWNAADDQQSKNVGRLLKECFKGK